MPRWVIVVALCRVTGGHPCLFMHTCLWSEPRHILGWLAGGLDPGVREIGGHAFVPLCHPLVVQVFRRRVVDVLRAGSVFRVVVDVGAWIESAGNPKDKNYF